MKQKVFYDVSAKSLSPLERNDPVRIEDDEGWNTKATVLQEVAPRSFTVRTEDGQVFRRNRRSLLKTPPAASEQSSNALPDKQNTTPDKQNTTPVKQEPRRSGREIKKPVRLNL